MVGERVQLNIRMDGRRDLIDKFKAAAAANGESFNKFCIRVLSEASGVSSGDTRPIEITEELKALIASEVESALNARLNSMSSDKASEVAIAGSKNLSDSGFNGIEDQEDQKPKKSQKLRVV